MSSAEFLKNFDEFYANKLKQELFKTIQNEPECIQEIIRRFETVTDYNAPHGKKLRGLAAYESLVSLTDTENDNLIDQSKAVGWCIELLQAAFLVADDIMDNSTMRRGQPCWYLVKGIGNVAINDSFYLLASVYDVISKFLKDHPMYPKFYELFNQYFMNTVIGQGLDLLTPPKVVKNEPFDFKNYNEDQYNSIVKWKTAFYSFCLPIQSALYLASIDNTDVHEKCKEILIEMGVFFQIQDDFLDCYGDPKVTGKVGTDIEESKCSWLVIQALKRVNAEQRLILENNYGRSQPENVLRVKELFNELKLKEQYEKYEQSTFESITSKIGNLKFADIDEQKTSRVKLILTNFAKRIFKRNK